MWHLPNKILGLINLRPGASPFLERHRKDVLRIWAVWEVKTGIQSLQGTTTMVLGYHRMENACGIQLHDKTQLQVSAYSCVNVSWYLISCHSGKLINGVSGVWQKSWLIWDRHLPPIWSTLVALLFVFFTLKSLHQGVSPLLCISTTFIWSALNSRGVHHILGNKSVE